jgi:hypothetical protein
VGSAVRVCTLHPPLTRPVAVKLAVKIIPEKDDHPHSYHLRRYPICHISRDLIPDKPIVETTARGSHGASRRRALYLPAGTRSGDAFDAAPRRVDRKWALSRQRILDPHA